MGDFVHLHTHSRMSIADGLNSFADIVARVKDIGQTAIAITDHYYMYNLPDFYFEALEQGIKPILGCELGIWPQFAAAGLPKDDITDAATKKDNTVAYFHGVFLAKNFKGYQNLMKLASIATAKDSPTDSPRDGHFFKKPRVCRKDILKYHEGLIFLSACVAGEIPKLILAGKEQEALKTAAWYKKVFGSDFYLELQDHLDDGELDAQQTKVNKTLIRWAKKYKFQLVLTNDCHYTTKDMADAHTLLLCANWRYDYNDKTNAVHTKYFPTPEFYIKSDAEMMRIAKKWGVPEAFDNTRRIADKCNVVIPKETHYPVAKLELADNPDDELRMLIHDKMWDKYREGDGVVYTADGKEIDRKVFDERLQRELSDIKTGKVADYFLNVYRGITSYCHENNIMIGAGRGSVAGSVVSYILNITDVEPILLNLTWERFWNPGRMKRDKDGNILEISLPDIDLDIPSDRREEVMDHCKEYWGEDCVASIVTFGTYSGKSVIDAVSTATSFVESYDPKDPKHKKGWDMLSTIKTYVAFGLSEALENNEQFQSLYESDKKVHEFIDMCIPLEGCTRNVSIHAAGILIADKSMVNYTPYDTNGKYGTNTQYPFETLEKLGCLKVDLLGHEAEVIIERACQYIEENHGVNIVPREIPTDDKKTFELLAACDTRGVPQLQEDWVLPIIRDVRPDRFGHVIDLITMIRPGSLDSGQTEKYRKIRRGEATPHPDVPQVADITDETYGCWLYQEQVMDVVKNIGDFTLEQADDLRKVVAKKKYGEKAEKLMAMFKENSQKNGKLSHKEWELLDDVIRKFFGYAFNKAHSAGYGTTSYRCAWLKANYFIEYMTSQLNSAKKERLPFYLENIYEHGFDLSAPDINVSGFYWTCEGGVLRPALSIVDKCGPTAVAAIVEERDLRGKFKSFEDFVQRAPSMQVKVNVIENLICCGAFDSLGYSRKVLYDACFGGSGDYIKTIRDGKGSLFGGKKGGIPKGGEEDPIEATQEDELNMMGFVITLTDEEKEKRRRDAQRSVRKYRGKGSRDAQDDRTVNSSGRTIGKRRSGAADRLAEKLAARRAQKGEGDTPAADPEKSAESLARIKSKLNMRGSSRKPDKPAEMPQDKQDVYIRVSTAEHPLLAKIYAALRRYTDDAKYRLVVVATAKGGDEFKLETDFVFNAAGYAKLKKLAEVWLE